MQELFMTGMESPELCCIYEDLHWTILFAGIILFFVLFDYLNNLK